MRRDGKPREFGAVIESLVDSNGSFERYGNVLILLCFLDFPT